MNIRRIALPLSLILKYTAKTGYAINQTLMPLHTRLYYWMRHTTQMEERLKSFAKVPVRNRIVNEGFTVHQRGLCGEIEQPTPAPEYVFTTTSDGGYVDGFEPGGERHHELPAIQANNRRIQESRHQVNENDKAW